MQDLEQELKALIVEALVLEDVSPEQINSDDPLFGEGLGLDSVDALELAMVIQKKYGVKVEADDVENRRIFASVKNLAAHIERARNQNP